MIPVVVSTSDKYLWAISPFSYLFQKYWGGTDVYIAGYTVPKFDLPNSFTFYSIATPQYEKEKWVDGFLKFLYQFPHDYFVLMLEDYWLCRNVDKQGIEILGEMMEDNKDLLRVDLTQDRQFAGGAKHIGYYNRFDILEAPQSQYQMSLQAGLWNKKLLINVLESLPMDLHSAWDVELTGTGIVNSSSMKVYGTYQCPIRYVNGMNNATSDKINFSGLMEHDIPTVKNLIEDAKKI